MGVGVVAAVSVFVVAAVVTAMLIGVIVTLVVELVGWCYHNAGDATPAILFQLGWWIAAG